MPVRPLERSYAPVRTSATSSALCLAPHISATPEFWSFRGFGLVVSTTHSPLYYTALRLYKHCLSMILCTTQPYGYVNTAHYLLGPAHCVLIPVLLDSI